MIALLFRRLALTALALIPVASAGQSLLELRLTGRSAQEQGKGPEDPLDRIVNETECLERDRSEQNAVAFFAKDDGRRSSISIDEENRIADFSRDLSSVRENEGSLSVRLNPELSQ